MNADEVARILSATYTYWVEVRHPGSGDWVHIHSPAWETSESYADAATYATSVRDDHPGSRVRIVERLDGYPDHHIPVA